MSHATTPPPVLIPKSLTNIQGAQSYLSKQRDALYEMWAMLDILLEYTPPAASSTGRKGTLARDDTYLYYCSDTDTWLRVSIASLFTTW